MTRLRLTLLALAAPLLAACMDATSQSAATTTEASAVATPPERTYLFSWGMFGDPVFDRDVETFTRAYTRAFGAPADMARYGANAPQLKDYNPDAIRADLARLAAQSVDGQDVMVVMLTSHGEPDAIVLQPTQGGPMSLLSADRLADLLAPLNTDRQVLILQACFSGSLIDELRHPNRIIMTAASATRSSFGCNPDSDNTWFIKSMNRAMAQGGSWEQIFARTQALVRADEAAAGFPASNPQVFVGRNMQDEWREGAV